MCSLCREEYIRTTGGRPKERLSTYGEHIRQPDFGKKTKKLKKKNKNNWDAYALAQREYSKFFFSSK